MPAFPDSGLILLDKSPGPTSHDAVLWARRALNEDKVGHCGSLDPFASGLLLLGVGEALKWQDRLMAERKIYEGTFRLGLATDTDDITGKPLPGFPKTIDPPAESDLLALFRQFTGRQMQTVPRYSAAKVKGKPLYAWARAGVSMDLPEKEIEIYRLEMKNYAPPDVRFVIECSKGTYVRALARDIGERLGWGATLVSLTRETIGPFSRAAAYAWRGERESRSEDLRKSFLSLGRVIDLLKDSPAASPRR
jgi:tRNA pseudouridine55 synthase